MFKWKYCKNLDKDNNPLLLKKKKISLKSTQFPAKHSKYGKENKVV